MLLRFLTTEFTMSEEELKALVESEMLISNHVDIIRCSNCGQNVTWGQYRWSKRLSGFHRGVYVVTGAIRISYRTKCCQSWPIRSYSLDFLNLLRD